MKLELHRGQREIISCPDRFIAVRAGRRFGKSFIFAVYAVWMAITNQNCRIICISKSQRQADELFQKIYLMTINSILGQLLIRNTQSKLVFDNNSVIESVPGRNPDALRGPTINLILADEAAYISDAMFDAIYPTIMNVRGKTLGKMVLISTPRFKSGEFYNAFKPDSDYTKFHMTYDDAIYDDGTRQMPEEELDREAKRCGGKDTAYFKREFGAEFGNADDSFFDDEGIEKSLTSDLVQLKYGLPNHKYTIGADLALSQDYTIFTVMDYTDKKNLKIVRTVRFNGKSTDQIMEELYKETIAFHPSQILIDDAKIGAAVVSHLKTNYPRYNWQPFNFNTTSKVPLMTDLNIAMCTGIIQIPDDDTIREELLSFYYEENINTGHLKLNGVGAHDDYPISIALALRAANVFSKPLSIMIGSSDGILTGNKSSSHSIFTPKIVKGYKPIII